MEERLCSFETSIIAKEKDFNIAVNDYSYIVEPEIVITVAKFNHNYKSHGNVTVSRPRQSLLQKWLRDEFDIFVEVKRIYTGSDEWEFSYAIGYLPRDKRDVKRRCQEFMHSYTSQRWNDYEDALEEGLKEGLKLI